MVDAREEGGEEVGDDLLERDVEAASAEVEEAWQALGDLDAREALFAGLGVLGEDREREREARDVRERLSRADREGREHGVDLAVEATLELLELLLPEILDAADDDALPRRARARSSRFQSRDCERRRARGRARGCERAPAGASARPRSARDARLGLSEEAGDAHLEELVEVGGEDSAEVHTLEQRERLVGRELEHARMELEVRELTVEEVLDRLGADFVAIVTLCIGSTRCVG